jgi:ribosomal protein S18 acetylase RimI-like enzyme
MLKIQELKAAPSLELFVELVELLQDVVGSGASLGFPAVPSTKDARNYWAQVLEAAARGERRMFVATEEHACAGAVQLGMAAKANGRHRGEVQKLMVHTQYRRRGIGRALLGALERAAAADGLALLVLDVREADPAEAAFRACGYQRVGAIPNFARAPDGRLHGTVIYYHELTSAAPGKARTSAV